MSLESYKARQFAAELGGQATDCCFWLCGLSGECRDTWRLWHSAIGCPDDYGIHVALSDLRRHTQVDAVHPRDAKLW